MAQTAQHTAREIAKQRRRAQYEMGKAGLDSMKAGNAAPHQSAAAPVASTSKGMTAREVSRARRDAMANAGKLAVKANDRTRSEIETGQSPTSTVPQSATPQQAQPATAAPAAETRDKQEGCGCGCKQREQQDSAAMTTSSAPKKYIAAAKVKVKQNPGRAASLARRQAMSSKGKTALNGAGPTAVQTARAANPNLSSREIAQKLREQRSSNGKRGEKKSQPCGRMRPGKQTSPAAAEDAPWKVGASETSHGQTVTGTMVGRSPDVTGDEPSTCRPVTGTEYMGADIFRQFCDSENVKSPSKVRVTSTATGNRVSGNELGRSNQVTGNEPGTCKRVTGNQYVGAEQTQAFCGTKPEKTFQKVTTAETRRGKSVSGNNVGRSDKVTGDEVGANRELTGTQYMQKGNGKAPAKVGSSATLRGGNISGTMVGRNDKVTGDEPGSCKNVTGDDYVGKEQYSSFCSATPKATDRKVGMSATLKGKAVTGTMTGRDSKVTGDEPGTCKAVTGTPYASAETYNSYCDSDAATLAAARTRPGRSTPGSVMTGLQPGINGRLTGAQKGACEPLTGTPYVGADQFAQACPSVPADTNSPDFPQTTGAAPWGQFSVASPNHASQTDSVHQSVTGTQYEKGHITGPFGKADGKITGTEDARFGAGNQSVTPAAVATQQLVEGRVQSRVTGEGQDAGLKITGDDWDRNERVTGTEGMSATRRNPTRRGENVSAMAMQQQAASKRNEQLPEPNSKVTGGSGNTEKGALITYSGGARG